jgi:hypothetical protein
VTTYAWPSTGEFVPSSFEYGLLERVGQSESTYTGAIGTRAIPFAVRRRYLLTLPATNNYAVHQRRIAFLHQIGRANRVTIPNWNFGRNGFAPFGTLRGTPTVTSSTAQGATSIAITTSVASQGLLAGDEVGLVTSAGLQVVTATANATAAGTALTLAFESPLRGTVAPGSAVAWNKPAPTFIQSSSSWSAIARPKLGEPISVELIEVW